MWSDAGAGAQAPSRRIVQEVLRGRHDLVMIAAEGGGDRRETVWSSTAARLMRDCPCPIWVLRQPRACGVRILAAVDPDPLDERRDALNEEILELAASLAGLQESELHVVHAWTACGESILAGPRSGLPSSEVQRYVCQTREAHRRRLDELLLRRPPLDRPIQAHLVKGDARRVIPDLAGTLGIESIVMGTVCREGLARWLIGNTAEVVLRRAGCSVLTAKPPGFVSRVSPDDRGAAQDG